MSKLNYDKAQREWRDATREHIKAQISLDEAEKKRHATYDRLVECASKLTPEDRKEIHSEQFGSK